MEPIFVAGCGRSGTTLLAAMLAAGRGVVAPPEAPFLAEGMTTAARDGGGYDIDAFAGAVGSSWRYKLWELPPGLPAELAESCSRPAELMAGLASAFAHAAGEPAATRWIDHTPVNIGFAPMLLAEFETAPMIHVVRDPRAVIASVLPLDWGPASAREGARWWLSMIGIGLAAEAAFPDRVVRVRYESLVREPDATLERLCSRLGLGFEAGAAGSNEAKLPAYTRAQHALVSKPPDPSRIDAWRSSLSVRQIAIAEAELRETPAMLGYDPAGVGANAGGRSAIEFAAASVQTVRQRLRHRVRIRRALKRRPAQPRR